MTLATYEDVAVLLGRDLTPQEQAATTAALVEASRAVTVYTGQRFEASAATWRGYSATGSVLVPQRPLSAVSGWAWYDESGAEHTGALADLTIVGNVVHGLPIGLLLEVDYTFGYTDCPDDIRGIVARAGLRVLTNLSTGMTSEQPRSDAVLWQVNDRRILDRYKSPARTIFLAP